jgi:hypothetical protein
MPIIAIAFAAILSHSLQKVGTRTNVPLDCPEYKWNKGIAAFERTDGPSRRYLVLCNGPENILNGYIPAGSDHTNLYWGAIPFEGTDLRLRVHIGHILDLNAKLDPAEIRFCVGVRGGNSTNSPGNGVRIVRDVSTTGTGPEGAYEYIEPGKMQAVAHLGQKWQTTLKPGTSIDVPNESESGDVTGVSVTMHKTRTGRFGNLTAELDLQADQPMKGRSLIVRTVLRTPGGGLGTCQEESCCDSGAGERGWWPQADIFVESDPKHPVLIRADSPSPYFGYFRLCERGGGDWATFNDFAPNHQGSKSNNAIDRFGTKNSGMWGVNVLYRVYYRGVGSQFTDFGSAIGGLLTGAAAEHIVSGPYEEGDDPWSKYGTGSLKLLEPGYVDRRSLTDFDLAPIGQAGKTDEMVRYFEYFVANIGASTYPTGLVILKTGK